MKLRCNSCGYAFDSEKMRDKCPYCGKKDALSEVESAEDLVEEL